MRRSIEFKPLVESNSFELLRGCLYHQQAVTFQFESGAVTDGGQLVMREIEDPGFPTGHILMARLAKRQLPVIAHAFAEHVLSGLRPQAG
jgi:hypothetical protein